MALAKLKVVGLDARPIDAAPSSLSGGMQHRVGIAPPWRLTLKCLLSWTNLRPVWIRQRLLDLDHEPIRQISHLFGITFVIVSHELASLISRCKVADNRVIMLDQSSRSLSQGKPNELRDDSSDPIVRRFSSRRKLEHQGP